MSPGHDRGAPRQESAAKLVATTTTIMAPTDDHGAIVAADATMFLNRYWWEQAIRKEAADGSEIAADTLQEKYGLPDVGNGTGGIFMALHREGVIRKIGYRASARTSRGGSVITVWVGGAAA